MADTPPHEVTASGTVVRIRANNLKLLYGTELDHLKHSNYNAWNSALTDDCIIADVMCIIDGSQPPLDMPNTNIAKSTSAIG